MLPFRLVYHSQYDLHLGLHVFPSQKYRLLRERLLVTRFATEDDFVEPEPATDADILLVHDPAWVTKLKAGTLSYHEILKLEIPYSRETVEAFWAATGGTIRATRLALESGVGFNVGGGFRSMGPSAGPWWSIAMSTRVTGRPASLPEILLFSPSRFIRPITIRPRS